MVNFRQYVLDITHICNYWISNKQYTFKNFDTLWLDDIYHTNNAQLFGEIE